MNYQCAGTSTTEKQVTTGTPIPTASTTIATRCEDENIMKNVLRVPGSSVSVEPTIPDDDIANLRNPDNDEPVQWPGNKVSITIVVDGTLTAIEIRGDNIEVASIEYTDSPLGELTEVVSITSFTTTFK